VSAIFESRGITLIIKDAEEVLLLVAVMTVSTAY